MERFKALTAAPVRHLSWIFVERNHGHAVSFPGGRQWDTLIVVTEGRLSFRFYDGEKETLIAKKGDCVFFPRGTKNTCTYQDETNKIISVQMQTAANMPFFCKTPYLFQNAANDNEIAEIIQSVQACENEEPQALSFFLTSQFYMLLYYLKRSFLSGENSAQMNRDYLRLKPVIDDMHQHYEKNRKTADYAAMVHMCDSGFRKLFTACTGQSPITYRNTVRMQRANDMLASGEYTVTQASKAVGVNNLSFFCREYKKYFGVCPGKRNER